MDLKSKYFYGFYNYSDFYLKVIGCLRNEYYDYSQKRSEEYWSILENTLIPIPSDNLYVPEIKDEFYLIVRSDSDLLFQFKDIYPEGNHYLYHLPPSYYRQDGGVKENIPAYGLIGLDQDSAVPQKKLNEIARETCRKPYNSKGD